MPVSFFDVVIRLEKLNILRRVGLSQISGNAGLYWGQLPILNYVAHHDGCTQQELAEKMGVTPSSIALSTKRLQKNGLIEKQVDGSNLRRKMLSVTQKGKDLAEQCRAEFSRFDQNLFSGFTVEELSTLKDMLDRLIYNIPGGRDSGIDFASMHALHRQEEKTRKGSDQ